jgi:hypothetical protein
MENLYDGFFKYHHKSIKRPSRSTARTSLRGGVAEDWCGGGASEPSSQYSLGDSFLATTTIISGAGMDEPNTDSNNARYKETNQKNN